MFSGQVRNLMKVISVVFYKTGQFSKYLKDQKTLERNFSEFCKWKKWKQLHKTENEGINEITAKKELLVSKIEVKCYMFNNKV